MSIFLPIFGADSAPGLAFSGSSVLAFGGTVVKRGTLALAGSSALELESTVEQHHRLALAGSSALAFAGAVVVAGSLALEGSSTLTLEGRQAVGAGNVFGRLAFAGSSALALGGTTLARAGGLNLNSASSLSLRGYLKRAEEFGFTFIVDVLDSATQAAQAARVRRYDAQLLVNGQSVPIISATWNTSPDDIGVELSVILARRDVAQVPADAVIDFERGLWTGTQWAWQPQLTSGKLNSRSQQLVNQNDLPADTVELTVLDLLADRWNRRPSRNQYLYDPEVVDAPTPQAIAGQTIYDPEGDAISPEYIASPYLSLHTLLKHAYVDGCGFAAFQTNIEDFPIEQATFSMTGGYDAGVRPHLEPFSPEVFAIGNVLWIVRADAPLPAGLAIADYTVSNIKDLTDTLPQHESINALLVKLKGEGGESSFTATETEESESGDFGYTSHVHTRTERQIRRWFNEDAPNVVVREELISLVTTVLDSVYNVISRETERDIYDRLGRKTGHTREIEMRLPDFNARSQETQSDGTIIVTLPHALQLAQKERQTIVYGPNPIQPTQDVVLRVETVQEGLILVDTGNPYLHRHYRLPYDKANLAGYIDPEADQHTEFGALKTTIETLRVRVGQIQVETRVMNHITNAPDRISITDRPGDTGVDRVAAGTRTVLLTIPGTSDDERRAAEFDATGLPPALGLKLAWERLYRLHTPPKEVAVSLAFPDNFIRQGLPVRLRDRVGAILGTYIVRGWTQTVSRNEDGVILPSINIRARQLTSR